MKKSNILVISDTQLPFAHKDALAFCKAVQEQYKCGRIIHIGDFSDQYWFSAYEKSPDAGSVTDELLQLHAQVQDWKAAFPKMEILIGNHDRRILHTMRKAGIPSMLYSDGEILDRALGLKKNSGWTWHKEIRLNHRFGSTVFIHGDQRGTTARAGGNVNVTGMSTVSGHRHSSAFVHYKSTSKELMYDMVVGCLIDDSKFPFDYNKQDLKRPILSIGVIQDGYPRLIEMRLDKRGRWTGEV